jgi:hypothetical protein
MPFPHHSFFRAILKEQSCFVVPVVLKLTWPTNALDALSSTSPRKPGKFSWDDAISLIHLSNLAAAYSVKASDWISGSLYKLKRRLLSLGLKGRRIIRSVSNDMMITGLQFSCHNLLICMQRAGNRKLTPIASVLQFLMLESSRLLRTSNQFTRGHII